MKYVMVILMLLAFAVALPAPSVEASGPVIYIEARGDDPDAVVPVSIWFDAKAGTLLYNVLPFNFGTISAMRITGPVTYEITGFNGSSTNIAGVVVNGFTREQWRDLRRNASQYTFVAVSDTGTVSAPLG